ncbi:hypothetical protein AB0F91_42925 [Amycolatopsis sp. NPDC023774]|uniref:hypothetical protein n=1 Tax=Amycolatopsis sp. NPDC023774 TaxID=3155015 RepID=UPI0033C4ADAB
MIEPTHQTAWQRLNCDNVWGWSRRPRPPGGDVATNSDDIEMAKQAVALVVSPHDAC